MSNVRFITLGNYARPEIVENQHLDWVEYGEDNDYFQYLIDRYYGSPTNNAIINSITDLVFGKGLAAKNQEAKASSFAKVAAMVRPECLRRAIQDFNVTGNCTFEIHQKNGVPTRVYHAAVNHLRAEKCNKKGEIKGFYYSKKWEDVTRKEDVEYFPNFEYDENSEVTILWVKKESIGTFYYAPVDYQGGLQYAELEEEVANYHINNIQNGLAPSMLINFNNGEPPEEEQVLIENKIIEKFSGSSNAGRAIVSFNDPDSQPATIEPVTLSDADKQYEFLSQECTNKLIRAHRITSPLLLGIREGNNGLGSNKDEMKVAFDQLLSTVIQPKQDIIINGLQKIFKRAGISLELYFDVISPIQFDEEQDEREETQLCSLNLSKDSEALDRLISNELIEKGEDEKSLLEDYELIDEGDVDYDLEDEEDERIKELNSQSKKGLFSKLVEFVSTGTARPNSKSEQDATVDGDMFKVRYEYSPKKAGVNSREFCRKMVQAGKIYRKEDIIAMDNKVVNAGFGEFGADTYSIWLYKGGARCNHRWRRKTYMKKGTEGSIDTRSPRAVVSTGKAEREGYRVRNPKEVSMKPNDMPLKGFSPRNPNLPKDVK